MLAHSASFYSTTSTRVDCSATEQRDDGDDVGWAIYPLLDTWSEKEIMRIKHSDLGTFDGSIVGRLRSFGFLGKSYFSENAGTPLWNFHPESMRKETCGQASGVLYCQSSALIERIPFEVMIQHALGRHLPELIDLHRKYEWLNAHIYSHFMNRRKCAKYLVQVKKVCSPTSHTTWQGINNKKALEECGADPFIRAVVQNAYECVQKKSLKDPDMDTILTRLITGPLKEHLEKSQPAEVTLHQAEVLRIRFARYIAGLDHDWSKPLDTSTDFMNDLQLLGPSGLARAITKADHAQYRKLDINSFREGGEAVKVIIRRCNNLTLSVQDCLDAQMFSASEMIGLAQVILRKSRH